MRGIKLILAAVAAMALMTVAALPASANDWNRGHGWNDCCWGWGPAWSWGPAWGWSQEVCWWEWSWVFERWELECD